MGWRDQPPAPRSCSWKETQTPFRQHCRDINSSCLPVRALHITQTAAMVSVANLSWWVCRVITSHSIQGRVTSHRTVPTLAKIAASPADHSLFSIIARQFSDHARTLLKWLLPARLQSLFRFWPWALQVNQGNILPSGLFCGGWTEPVRGAPVDVSGRFMHEMNAERQLKSALRRRHLHCRLERKILP